METYETIAKAQELYLHGSTKVSIAEQLNVHRKAVENWSKRFGWDEIRDEIRKNVKKKVQQSQEEIQNRLLTIYRNFQIKGHERVMSGEEKVSAVTALKAAEQEAKLMGLDVQRIRLEDTESINQKTDKIRNKLSKLSKEDRKKFSEILWDDGDTEIK